jgi:hypothetical protein
MMRKLLLGLFLLSLPAYAAPPAPGQITGTITTDDKRPVQNGTTLLVSGCFVDLQQFAHEAGYNPNDTQFARGVLADSTRASRQQGDLKLGGLFTFDNLKPGVYNLLVENGQLGTQSYAPQRIVGVVVHPGQTVNLDIVMHPGRKLEWIGQPLCNVAHALKVAWLEGTFTAPDGQAVASATTLIVSGVKYTLKLHTPKGQVTMETDHAAGGFFSYMGMRPGVYDVIVEKGMVGTQPYRPLIIQNLVLKAGVHTALTVVLHPGLGLERVPAPQVGRTPIQIAR